MMTKVGIVFDMDGVLVDTVDALYHIYLSILADYQVQGSKAEFHELNGPSLKEISTLLSSRYSSMPTPEKITKAFQLAHNSLYEKVELVPNVIETLKELSRLGVKIGLASSSNRHNIDLTLKRFNLAQYFDFTLSGDEVKNAKPHPEIYQISATNLNCRNIYAIDDSYNGIKSALNAGLSAIQFTKDDPLINEHASYKIDTLQGVTNILKAEYQLFGCYDQFTLCLAEYDLSPYLPLINDYWLKHKNEAMFDGNALLCLRVCGNKIHVIKHTYKTVFYILHNTESALAKILSPIGVSGFVLDINNNILLAQRSSLVTQYKEAYECPPSGNLESINNYENQLLIELEEEVNIPKEAVSLLSTMMLIKDKKANQFDIICKIQLKSNLELHIKNNIEYKHFQPIPVQDLHAFVTTHNCLPETLLFHELLK